MDVTHASNFTSSMQTIQKLHDEANQLATNNEFPQALQRLERAIALLAQIKSLANDPQTQQEWQKVQQRCTCNAGWFAHRGGLHLRARQYYRLCLTTKLKPRAESTIRQRLQEVNQLILAMLATLIVRTVPSGAKLQLLNTTDPQAAGQVGTTPFLAQIEPGQYRLSIHLAGYHPVQVDISLNKGAKIERDYELKRLSTLVISTNPTGASVQIKGPHKWMTTATSPKTFSLPSGLYDVLVQKEGYRPYRESLEITEGKEIKRQITLSPLLSTLIVKTSPPQARITLYDAQNKKHSGVSPWQVQIPSGSWRVAISKPGYIPISQQIEMAHNTKIERHYTLDLLVPPKRKLARTLAWSSVGLAVAAAGVGIVMTVIAQQKFEYVRINKGKTETDDEFLKHLISQNDLGTGLQIGGAISFGLSAVATIAAIWLFVWDGGKAKIAHPSPPHPRSPSPPKTSHNIPRNPIVIIESL
jgi:hypothetical protein